MENTSPLDHLLQIENRAAALVRDAQEEADRRIIQSEEKNHAAYEENYRAKVQMLEAMLHEETEKTRKLYKEALDEYRLKISDIDVRMDRFSSLLNEFLAAQL